MRLKHFCLIAYVMILLSFQLGTGWGKDTSKIGIGVLPGVQLFPFMVMEKFGLPKKYGIDVERKDFQNPQAVSVQLSQKSIDIGFIGWTFPILLQSKGYDVINIYSFALNNNVVIVKEDSPIKTLSDLRGKRVGLYGGPAGLSTVALKIICKKYYKLDLEQDAKVHYGTPIAQAGLFEKGDLDAILSLDPVATITISKGNCRIIAQIDKEWQRYRKHPPILVCMVSTRDFVNANTKPIENFIRAFRESIAILNQNDAIWTELAAAIGIKESKAANILMNSLRGIYIDTWDPSTIAEIKTEAEEGYELLGDKFLPVKWEEKAFDLRFSSVK
jgi:ABC-type nitrate/sulfonate/bicarbonate transport system substrate-binding protein